TIEHPQQIDASGKNPSLSNYDYGTRRRQSDFLETGRESFAEFEAEGVGLTIRHAQERHAIPIAELDHIVCSLRVAGALARSATIAGWGLKRCACATATASTTIARP